MWEVTFGKWVRFHELIQPISALCKFQQGLEVLYQHIKRQHATDDPRLVTYDIQVLFIIIFDMNHEFYVQVLFWFLAGGSEDVQNEAGRM